MIHRSARGTIAAAILALTACAPAPSGGAASAPAASVAPSVAATAAATPAAKQKVTVVFAHAQVVPNEEIPLWAVPMKLGYFEQEGLEVDKQFANGSAAALQVLASGTAQFAHTDKTTLIATRDKGVKAVAELNLQRVWPYDIAVQPDSPIKDMKDLKGKTIGVPSLASGAVPYVRRVYKEAGLDPDKDLKLVAAGTGAQATTALVSKQIDALALWGGAYAVIESAGTKLRHMHSAFEENVSSLVQATTDDYAKQSPKVVTGLTRAMVKGLIFTKANPEAAVRIFYEMFPQAKPADPAKGLATDVSALHGWLDYSFTDAKPVGQFTKDEWATAQEMAIDVSMTSQKGDLAQYWTDQFVKDAIAFDQNAVVQQAKTYK